MFKLRKEHLALLSYMKHLTHWCSLQIKKLICSALKQNVGNGTATEKASWSFVARPGRKFRSHGQKEEKRADAAAMLPSYLARSAT